MNKKFVIAWTVLFVAWFMGSFVVHGVLLRSDYMQLTNLFRRRAHEQILSADDTGAWCSVIRRVRVDLRTRR